MLIIAHHITGRRVAFIVSEPCRNQLKYSEIHFTHTIEYISLDMASLNSTLFAVSVSNRKLTPAR